MAGARVAVGEGRCKTAARCGLHHYYESSTIVKQKEFLAPKKGAAYMPAVLARSGATSSFSIAGIGAPSHGPNQALPSQKRRWFLIGAFGRSGFFR